MRVLVCGGRDYADKEFVFATLDRLLAKHKLTLLINGQAKGADAISTAWASQRGVALAEFPANWIGDGKRAAGPIRNRRMVDCIPPDAVIAFPGGTGTADMVSVARERGIPVWEPCP